MERTKRCYKATSAAEADVKPLTRWRSSLLREGLPSNATTETEQRFAAVLANFRKDAAVLQDLAASRFGVPAVKTSPDLVEH